MSITIPSVIDTTILLGLKSDLVEEFLRTAPIVLDKMKAAFGSSDLVTLRNEAHHFKFQCGSIGATSTANLCQSIETNHALSESEIRSLLDQLRSNCGRAKAELNDWIRSAS